MSQDRPGRLSLLIPFGVLLGVIVLHAVYWFVVAGQIRGQADRWIAEQEAAGYVVSHEGLSVGGYPFRFSLRVVSPDIAAPTAEGGWQAQAERLAATAQFYDLNHWILTPGGEVALEAMMSDGPARWVAGFESAQMSLLSSGGVTTRIGASMTGLALAAEAGAAPVIEAVGALNLSGFLGEEDVFALRIQADEVQIAESQLDDRLENAFSREIELWRMEGVVTHFDALARVGDPAEWRRAGGALDVTRAQLIWGAADVSGAGQIALDADLLPAGRLSVVVTDPETLIGALVQADLVHEEQGDALSLAALMAPRRESGIALPFRLQNGAVFLGPARLGTFAEREAVEDEE